MKFFGQIIIVTLSMYNLQNATDFDSCNKQYLINNDLFMIHTHSRMRTKYIIYLSISTDVSFLESDTNQVMGIETKLNPARVRNNIRNIDSDSSDIIA